MVRYPNMYLVFNKKNEVLVFQWKFTKYYIFHFVLWSKSCQWIFWTTCLPKKKPFEQHLNQSKHSETLSNLEKQSVEDKSIDLMPKLCKYALSISDPALDNIIDVENYESKYTHGDISIDTVLKYNNLFKINPFVYNVDDCPFDSLQVLLHMRYTSVELRNGIVDHFLNCLVIDDPEALFSHEYELDP